MPTVIVAESNAGMAGTIADLVDRQPGMAVIARASDRRSTARLMARHRPDVLLLDASLAGKHLGALTLLQQASPSTRIVVTAIDDRDTWEHELERAHAAGYISKSSPASAWGPALAAAAQQTSFSFRGPPARAR